MSNEKKQHLKGSARSIMAITIFLGFMILFTTFLIPVGEQTGVGFNATANNLTIGVSGDVPSVENLCQLSGSTNVFINAIQSFINVIPAVNCAFGFFSYLYSYATISTTIAWLSIIITACIIALIYEGVKLVRGS